MTTQGRASEATTTVRIALAMIIVFQVLQFVGWLLIGADVARISLVLESGPPAADVNRDGRIDVLDVQLVVNAVLQEGAEEP